MKEPLLALKALDRNDRVLYLGTFSKSIGPGLRLGYLVVPAHLAVASAAMVWKQARPPNRILIRLFRHVA
jgi:DNA-binding transcriptional MocR family regulator